MSTGLKANSDGSAAIQVGGTDVITLTSGGAATFVTSPTTVQAGTAAAPSITFSGDTNTGIYSPGADQVAIATGGSQRTVVDASGTLKTNVGGVEGIQLATDLNTSSVSSRLFFSETGSTVALFNSSGNLLFNTGVTKGSSSGTTRVAFGATGIGLGNTISNSGVGITFPATQSASSDANTLDDYEEGTFTPTVSGTTVAGTGTYNLQVGTYTKIGRLVMVTVTVSWTAHTGTGNLSVSNLPFTSANITGAYSTFVMDYVTLTVPASSLAFGEMGPNQSYATIFSIPTGTASAAGLAMDTAAALYFSLTYQAS